MGSGRLAADTLSLSDEKSLWARVWGKLGRHPEPRPPVLQTIRYGSPISAGDGMGRTPGSAIRSILVAAVMVISGFGVSVLIAGPTARSSPELAHGALSPAVDYALTFTESGLVAGTNWTVDLSGTNATSADTSIVFEEPSGSYGYTIIAPYGFAATPASGTAVVSGAPTSVPVTMAANEGGAAVLELYTLYNSRPDLQSAFPNAATDLSSFERFVSWAGYLVVGQENDSAAVGLYPYGAWILLMSVYNARADLQAAFANAYTDFSSYVGLVTWAGDVVTGTFSDPVEPTLAPFAYWYTLMMVYNSRADLLSTFPDAYGNSSSFTGLVNWAGAVVTGAITDPASSKLDAYGFYYALRSLYDGRADLQAAFPDAFTDWVEEGALLSWAGAVVNKTISDASQARLAPYGSTLVLFWVYLQRPDLQQAFPLAGTNGGALERLLYWAKEVVTGKISDRAASTLSAFASTFETTANPGFTYVLTVSESGYSSSSLWDADVYASSEGFFELGSIGQESYGTQMQFQVTNGSYEYEVFSENSNYSIKGSDGGAFTIDGAGTSVSVTFVQHSAYAVKFTESGLPSGANWDVAAENETSDATSTSATATGTSVTLYLINGTYSYTTDEWTYATDAATENEYTVTSGSVTVSGAAITKGLSFATQSTGIAEFSESGLPSGTSWAVSIGSTAPSSTTSTISYTAPAEELSYSVGSVTGYVTSSSSGSVTITDSETATVDLTFLPIPTFAVTYHEVGLPSGTVWFVLTWLDGTVVTNTSGSDGTSLTIDQFNGTYEYEALANASGYAATPTMAPFAVNGAPVTLTIDFADNGDTALGEMASENILLGGVFAELGEPGFTTTGSWGLTFNGVTETGIGFVLVFPVAGGTYSYSLNAPAGFVAPASGGTATVVAPDSGYPYQQVGVVILTIFEPMDYTVSFV